MSKKIKFSTKHTRKVGENYFQHMLFALAIWLRLSVAAGYFFVHAMVPWIKIPTKYNLYTLGLWISISGKERIARASELRRDNAARNSPSLGKWRVR